MASIVTDDGMNGSWFALSCRPSSPCACAHQSVSQHGWKQALIWQLIPSKFSQPPNNSSSPSSIQSIALHQAPKSIHNSHHQQPLQSTSPKPLNPKQSSRLFAPLCAFRLLVLLLVGWLLVMVVVSPRHYQNSLPFSTSMGGSGPIMFSPTLLLLIHLSHSNQSDNLQHGFDVIFNQPWLTGVVIWTLRERPLLDLQVRITVHDASGNLKTERNFVLSTNFGEKEHWWKGAAQESKLASALPPNSLLFCSKGYSLSLGTSFQWAVLINSNGCCWRADLSSIRVLLPAAILRAGAIAILRFCPFPHHFHCIFHTHFRSQGWGDLFTSSCPNFQFRHSSHTHKQHTHKVGQSQTHTT